MPQLLESRRARHGHDVRRLAVNMLFAHKASDPTGDRTTLESLGLAHPERAPYVASPWWILRWLMPKSSVRDGDVRIETADATAFAVPDTMTHADMFNPFRGRTFETVVENIIASLHRRPRELRLIYVQPEEHDALMRTGRFRLERKVHTTRIVGRTGVATYRAS